jgi:transcriptional regulator with XRE-family HTH domain
MPLDQLRHALALSQAHLAEILHVDQPSISKLERRTDMMVSTLARFIEAMGGQLEMKAVFPTGEVKITGLARLGREARAMAGEARAEAQEMDGAARRRTKGRTAPAAANP